MVSYLTIFWAPIPWYLFYLLPSCVRIIEGKWRKVQFKLESSAARDSGGDGEEEDSDSERWGGHTDKKEKKIFLIYKEIQMVSVAKSYMRKGFLTRLWVNRQIDESRPWNENENR